MEMGMSKFVKLTEADGGATAYVNMDHVKLFWPMEDGGTRFLLPDDEANDYTETPEQILALIEGPSGEYEPF